MAWGTTVFATSKMGGLPGLNVSRETSDRVEDMERHGLKRLDFAIRHNRTADGVSCLNILAVLRRHLPRRFLEPKMIR